jgi:alpha-glucosidase
VNCLDLKARHQRVVKRFKESTLGTCLKMTIILLAALLVAPRNLSAAAKDNNVEWDGLFADQGPLYMIPTEPDSRTPVVLNLRVFKGDITSANVKYWDMVDNSFHWVPMVWLKTDLSGIFDIWQAVVPASASVKYYRFQINDGTAIAWLNAGGIASNEPSAGDFWIVPGLHTPTWAKNAIYYQIFPDRFNNADLSNDLVFKSSSPVAPDSNGQCPSGSYFYVSHCAYQHTSWSELPENPGAGADFFGGDLAGITGKIDSYLKGTLGVTALYLNPIFQSPSNHKYDTQDYTLVDPHFGTNADLQKLINTAHNSSNTRMAVLLDGVFNHTSTFHRWFDQQHLYPTDGAAESRSSAWSDRYVFLTWPSAYCDWDGYASLPKLNYSSSSLRDDIYRRSDSVMQTYLKAPYSVDGWRYDVADNLVSITGTPSAGSCGGTDNHAIWQQVRPYVKNINAEALMLGEQWGNADAWINGKEWDAVMNYNGFNAPISEWINCQDVHGNRGQCLTVTAFDQWLRGTLADYPRPTQLAQMNSLSTHDTARFLWRADGDEWKMKLAIIVQMTYVGAPAIYYGDEIGMTGNNDPDDRRTFNWNSATWNQNILKLYQTLIRVRKQVSAFTDGSFKALLIDDSNKLYGYGRWDAASWAVVVVNNDGIGHSATIPAYQLSIPDGTILIDRLTGTTYKPSGGTISIPASALLGHFGVVLTAIPTGGTGRN